MALDQPVDDTGSNLPAPISQGLLASGIGSRAVGAGSSGQDVIDVTVHTMEDYLETISESVGDLESFTIKDLEELFKKYFVSKKDLSDGIVDALTRQTSYVRDNSFLVKQQVKAAEVGSRTIKKDTTRSSSTKRKIGSVLNSFIKKPRKSMTEHFREDLNTAHTLSKDPLALVDKIAEIPFKGLDAVGELGGKVASSVVNKVFGSKEKDKGKDKSKEDFYGDFSTEMAPVIDGFSGVFLKGNEFFDYLQEGYSNFFGKFDQAISGLVSVDSGGLFSSGATSTEDNLEEKGLVTGIKADNILFDTFEDPEKSSFGNFLSDEVSFKGVLGGDKGGGVLGGLLHALGLGLLVAFLPEIITGITNVIKFFRDLFTGDHLKIFGTEVNVEEVKRSVKRAIPWALGGAALGGLLGFAFGGPLTGLMGGLIGGGVGLALGTVYNLVSSMEPPKSLDEMNSTMGRIRLGIDTLLPAAAAGAVIGTVIGGTAGFLLGGIGALPGAAAGMIMGAGIGIAVGWSQFKAKLDNLNKYSEVESAYANAPGFEGMSAAMVTAIQTPNDEGAFAGLIADEDMNITSYYKVGERQQYESEGYILVNDFTMPNGTRVPVYMQGDKARERNTAMTKRKGLLNKYGAVLVPHGDSAQLVPLSNTTRIGLLNNNFDTTYVNAGAGGAFPLLIPRGASEYWEYLDVRGDTTSIGSNVDQSLVDLFKEDESVLAEWERKPNYFTDLLSEAVKIKDAAFPAFGSRSILTPQGFVNTSPDDILIARQGDFTVVPGNPVNEYKESPYYGTNRALQTGSGSGVTNYNTYNDLSGTSPFSEFSFSPVGV